MGEKKEYSISKFTVFIKPYTRNVPDDILIPARFWNAHPMDFVNDMLDSELHTSIQLLLFYHVVIWQKL